jgi:hypothetical protein
MFSEFWVGLSQFGDSLFECFVPWRYRHGFSPPVLGRGVIDELVCDLIRGCVCDQSCVMFGVTSNLNVMLAVRSFPERSSLVSDVPASSTLYETEK